MLKPLRTLCSYDLFFFFLTGPMKGDGPCDDPSPVRPFTGSRLVFCDFLLTNLFSPDQFIVPFMTGTTSSRALFTDFRLFPPDSFFRVPPLKIS